MKQSFFQYLFLLFLLLCTGCSSHSIIKIESSPKAADVVLVTSKGKEIKMIGKTPLLLDENKLESLKIGDGFIRVQLKKNGFKSKDLFLTEIAGSNYNLFFTLKPLAKLDQARVYDSLSVRLFSAQRYVRQKNYMAAVKLLKKVVEEFPELSVPYEMLGSTYYLQKEFHKAYNSFKTAYGLNPKNIFAKKMYMRPKK